ncbi:xylulokinase [Vibrio sp. SCSIO 43137]|uniref:xylulokinase n=1 Tax=Vibrio sp. SCSIO 43137 TaxID=3021011 RepID=UPI002307D717|nr:xylulokinase [Vibrio sp. SCSIO 43137]WCE32518.1 xylulokinase [Vibrio sp. SCSIO 43137]
MYIGIDLGTSGVKVILMDDSGQLICSATEPLEVSRPQQLWSEQDPEQWWNATCSAFSTLKQKSDLSLVKGIGLSGQMHGAVLLDNKGAVLRPAILWNDGRSYKECSELEQQVPLSREITGNIMMAGFTAPKLKWVQKNEPELFGKIHKVLLPKDYLRYRLSGDFASDMSDSAGTMWLDVARRDWSDDLLAACGLSRQQMPKLYEGCEVTNYLSSKLSEKWGIPEVAIAAGAGDNAAGAVGVGIVEPGQAMLSLGTSGVYFSVSDGFSSNPDSALHSFCHALPGTWHTMSVTLSAASCLDWVASLTGQKVVGLMLAETEQKANPHSDVVFLPYLSGERTPHNDPKAKGVFFGMTHDTSKADLVQAVLEGVGFALADGLDALHEAGEKPEEIALIGGGARSGYWRQMLADIFEIKLAYRSGGEVGPALGAARLAKLATTDNVTVADICPVPELVEVHTPNKEKSTLFKQKRQTYQKLYGQLKDLF